VTAGRPCIVWMVIVDGGMGEILGRFVATRNTTTANHALYLMGSAETSILTQQVREFSKVHRNPPCLISRVRS
jgi:hypothetical protein